MFFRVRFSIEPNAARPASGWSRTPKDRGLSLANCYAGDIIIWRAGVKRGFQFSAKAQRGEATTNLVNGPIQRKGRQGFRKGRKADFALRSSAPIFASSALKNLRGVRRCWEIALQRRQAAKLGRVCPLPAAAVNVVERRRAWPVSP